MDYAAENQVASVFSRQQWAALGNRRWLAACNLLLAALGVGLFCGYLWLNNRTSAYGFAIHDLDKKIEKLQDEKRRLDLDVLSRRAMDSVEARVTDLGFVPVDGVDYIVTGGSGVAMK